MARGPIARLAKVRYFDLKRSHLPGQFAHLVHDHDTGHDGQPQIADFAELALEMADIAVEPPGEIGHELARVAAQSANPSGLPTLPE